MISQPFEARMLQYGYQQIKSDAQAAQLIRRELKGMSAEQRRLNARGKDIDRLLRIKVGAWYRFQARADGVRRKNLFIVEETRYPPEDSRALPGAERPTSPPPPKKRNPEVTVGHSQEYVNMLNAYIRKLKKRLGEYECPSCGEKDRKENRYTHPVSADVVCFQCGELWE